MTVSKGYSMYLPITPAAWLLVELVEKKETTYRSVEDVLGGLGGGGTGLCGHGGCEHRGSAGRSHGGSRHYGYRRREKEKEKRRQKERRETVTWRAGPWSNSPPRGRASYLSGSQAALGYECTECVFLISCCVLIAACCLLLSTVACKSMLLVVGCCPADVAGLCNSVVSCCRCCVLLVMSNGECRRMRGVVYMGWPVLLDVDVGCSVTGR